MGRHRDESPRPLDVGDPGAKFPHPANAPALAWLARDAAVSASPSNENVDEYVLRTHPDLSDALYALARELPARQRGAYGVAVLATRGGVIFAVALSMRALGLRLPEREWPLAIEMGGMPWPEMGADWMRFDAWDTDVPARQHAGDLQYFTEVAHRHARALEAESGP